jgi:hypothetical protein
MSYGDGPFDGVLRDAWHSFCEELKRSGDLVFKEYNPPSSLQRADGFRYLTQSLSQAFDLALETKNPRYPELHPFCGPHRKLGADCADFSYLQAWIDGGSIYKISGKKGTARFLNFTVQGPRPETRTYSGVEMRNLHEPFGDTPEANLFGHELDAEWDGSFVLYVGGERRGPNWLPTTPGSRKLFLRQGFDRWDEVGADYRIERIGMDGPPPPPTHETILDAVAWAGKYLKGCMTDWPDLQIDVGQVMTADLINAFPGMPAAAAGGQDRLRGRSASIMRWRLAPDEALVVEFQSYDGFWMFTNMGIFCNSMDYIHRTVSFTPARATVDGDGRIRLVMSHADPGFHNWLDTQGFSEGCLAFRNVMSADYPPIETRIIPLDDLASELPLSRRVGPGERAIQLRERYDAMRRRFKI